jgi:hypothetical protein
MTQNEMTRDEMNDLLDMLLGDENVNPNKRILPIQRPIYQPVRTFTEFEMKIFYQHTQLSKVTTASKTIDSIYTLFHNNNVPIPLRKKRRPPIQHHRIQNGGRIRFGGGVTESISVEQQRIAKARNKMAQWGEKWKEEEELP